MYSETIWTFETANFRVAFEACEEFDVDLSWDDDGSVAEGIDSGALTVFCAHMVVTHKPTGIVLGEDYLGQCIYKSADEFIDHRGCKAGGYGSYFSDMVRDAIREARNNLEMLKAA